MGRPCRETRADEPTQGSARPHPRRGQEVLQLRHLRGAGRPALNWGRGQGLSWAGGRAGSRAGGVLRSWRTLQDRPRRGLLPCNREPGELLGYCGAGARAGWASRERLGRGPPWRAKGALPGRARGRALARRHRGGAGCIVFASREGHLRPLQAADHLGFRGGHRGVAQAATHLRAPLPGQKHSTAGHVPRGGGAHPAHRSAAEVLQGTPLKWAAGARGSVARDQPVLRGTRHLGGHRAPCQRSEVSDVPHGVTLSDTGLTLAKHRFSFRGRKRRRGLSPQVQQDPNQRAQQPHQKPRHGLPVHRGIRGHFCGTLLYRNEVERLPRKNDY
eukprot:RCo039427